MPWRFLKSRVFLIPVSIIVLLELFLRSGLYEPLLKPESFAYNATRIRRVVKGSSLHPNVLILGTSVAYQGILTPELNRSASADGFVFQNAATQGAMIETQHAVFRDVAPALKDLRWIVHVAEVNFPWQTRYELEPANRTMLAQFPLSDTLALMRRDRVDLSSRDYAFFYLRTLTFQGDLRDFVLNPPRRFKAIARQEKVTLPDYVYLNRNRYAVSAYGHSAEECAKNARDGIPPKNEAGEQITDEPHRTAVLDTCRMAGDDHMKKPGGTAWKSVFFHRLREMHRDARQSGLRVVTVFAPYSDLVPYTREEARLDIWKQELNSDGDYFPEILDLRHALDGPDNLDLFYDTIHLNRPGAERFTAEFQKVVVAYLHRAEGSRRQNLPGRDRP